MENIILKEISRWETNNQVRSILIEDVTETIRDIISYFVSKHHNYYICDDDINRRRIRVCKKQMTCLKEEDAKESEYKEF